MVLGNARLYCRAMDIQQSLRFTIGHRDGGLLQSSDFPHGIMQNYQCNTLY